MFLMVVLWYGYGGCECLFYVGCMGFQCGDFVDLLQQCWVVCCVQVDVVWKQGCVDDVVLFMYCIDVEQYWNGFVVL